MPVPISIRFSNGLVDLNKVSEEMASTVAKGFGAPTAMLVGIMKRKCPVGKTGNLRNSIGAVIGTVPSKNLAYAVVGPRRRSKGTPTRYAHLVEFGHVAVHPDKGARRRKGTARDITYVPAKPFVRPAVEEYAAQVGYDLAKGVEPAVAASIRANIGGKRKSIVV